MRLIELAARTAKAGTDDRNFQLGCVAVRKDGAIVVSTNEMTRTPQPSGHAESRALRKAGHGATLYVARVTRNGDLAMAKPCPRCQALIRSFGVVKVHYTIDNESIGVWSPQKDKKPDSSVGYK